MATDRGVFTPIEAIQSHKQEWQFAKSTTVYELFQSVDLDPSLKLAAAPLHIGKTQVDETTTQYVGVIDRPLLGKSFHRFLSATAPVPVFRNDPTGIINDWNMYDDPGEKKRQDRHDIALGKHMATFKIYRESLIRNLRASENLRPYVDPVTPEVIRGYLIKELETQAIIHLGWKDEKLPANFTRMFAAHLKSDKYKRREYYIDSDDAFMVAMFGMRDDLSHKLDVYWDFIQELNGDQRKSLAQEVEWFRFRGLEPGKSSYLGLGTIEPVISWQTTANPDGSVERSITCDPLDENTTSQLDRKLADEGNGLVGFLHYNPMVGALLPKYFMPEIGKNWPKKLGHGAKAPHDTDNFMGEQAVLVLGSMMRNQVLADGIRFFEKIEQGAA